MVISTQEELAASKLREAESNLALKDLRSKVSDFSQKIYCHDKYDDHHGYVNSDVANPGDGAEQHVAEALEKGRGASNSRGRLSSLLLIKLNSTSAQVPSTPKKLLGSLLEGKGEQVITIGRSAEKI